MDLPALTRPEHLAWLLLLPVLFWLSRPHRPHRVIATPHLAQWLRAQARLRRRPVRLRWLRFLLLALAFSASVLALCGPTLGGREGPRALAVLVDVSGSLAATAQDPPWRRLRAELASRLKALPDDVPVRMALCGDGVSVVEGSVEELLAALPSAPAGPGRADLGPLAQQLADSAPDVAVWTLTDGLGATVPPAAGALTVVGEPRANVGFTGLAIEDHWPLPEVKLTLELRSFDATPKTLQIAVEGGVEPADPLPVTLGPGAVQQIDLALRRAAGGPVRVYLVEHRDGLALDDAVALQLPPPPAVDIAFFADEEAGPWLELAARVLAGETGGRVVGSDQASVAGFVLTDGGIFPQAAGSMRFLTFGTRSSEQPLAVEDVVARPRIIDWDRTDPITQGLDLSELQVTTCLRRDFIGTGKPLISAEHGPLLVVDEGETWTSVHAAFRLGDSNLPQLPAFPQLLRRAFAHSFRDLARPTPSPDNLLSAAESDLGRRADAGAYRDRAVPALGHPGTSLAVPLLLLALLALALRVYA